MKLKDLNLRIALLKAISDAITEEVANARQAHRDELVERYVDEGTKSFDVRLPNGTKVGAISLTVPKAVTEVTDEELLLKWARENAPDLIEEVTIPGVAAHFVEAVPERTEFALNAKRITELLDRVKPVESAGGEVVDPDTGSLVDGVTYTPGGTPKSFSVRYEEDGREALALAYRAGELSHLVGGTPLPAVETAGGDQ